MHVLGMNRSMPVLLGTCQVHIKHYFYHGILSSLSGCHHRPHPHPHHSFPQYNAPMSARRPQAADGWPSQRWSFRCCTSWWLCLWEWYLRLFLPALPWGLLFRCNLMPIKELQMHIWCSLESLLRWFPWHHFSVPTEDWWAMLDHVRLCCIIPFQVVIPVRSSLKRSSLSKMSLMRRSVSSGDSSPAEDSTPQLSWTCSQESLRCRMDLFPGLCFDGLMLIASGRKLRGCPCMVISASPRMVTKQPDMIISWLGIVHFGTSFALPSFLCLAFVADFLVLHLQDLKCRFPEDAWVSG